MNDLDGFIAALTAKEPCKGVRNLLCALAACSEERGGCDGCPVLRPCFLWWDTFGSNATAANWRRHLIDWKIIAARKDLESPGETPARAPTRSRQSAAAARAT